MVCACAWESFHFVKRVDGIMGISMERVTSWRRSPLAQANNGVAKSGVDLSASTSVFVINSPLTPLPSTCSLGMSSTTNGGGDKSQRGRAHGVVLRGKFLYSYTFPCAHPVNCTASLGRLPLSVRL
jgi:hypothetical protein